MAKRNQNNPVMYSPFGKTVNGVSAANYGKTPPKPASIFGNFGATPNNAQDISNLSNVMFPTSNRQTYTSDGLGGLKSMGAAGKPTMEQFQGGLMHDLNLENTLNNTNYARNQQALSSFLDTGSQAAQRFTDPNSSGQQFFDQAQKYAQAGLQDSQQAEDRLNSQLASAQRSQAVGQQNSLAMYNQAINQSGQGTDKIASAMSAAAQRKGADQLDQMANQMSGALPGTESQLQDAARTTQRDINESVFSNVSQIQNRANEMQSQLMAGKAQLAGNLADSAAQFRANSAQMGFNANQSKNRFNELGANIATGNAAFQLQNNQAFMNAVASQIGAPAMQFVGQFPMLGVSVMSTMIAMDKIGNQFGNMDETIANPAGGGGLNTGQADLRASLSEQRSRQLAGSQGLNYAGGTGRQTIRMQGTEGGAFGGGNRTFDTNYSTQAGQQALQNSRNRTAAMRKT